MADREVFLEKQFLACHRILSKVQVPVSYRYLKGLVMDVCIDVPDDVVHRMQGRWEDLSRSVLEALAIEAYRCGVITEAEVQRMLNLESRWHVDEFLRRANAYIDYTEADLQQDIDSIRKLRQG
jgi:hypothetical protein